MDMIFMPYFKAAKKDIKAKFGSTQDTKRAGKSAYIFKMGRPMT
jgi:hypothetical protein